MEKGKLGYQGSADYIASRPLMEIVDVSIILGKPLVIKGEPGTGKTLLAHSISRALGKKLLVWNVKSTTKAKDGLYVYDTVQRLNDARFKDRDISDIRQYIKLGKLGQAFASEEQVVLLIDEIDKADIEFPNDLLNELDEMTFYINE
jgi:MoxR-like ATPase